MKEQEAWQLISIEMAKLIIAMRDAAPRYKCIKEKIEEINFVPRCSYICALEHGCHIINISKTNKQNYYKSLK